MEVKLHLDNPKRERSSISAIVYYNKKRFKKSTGISVLTQYWDSSSHKAKVRKNYREAVQINYELMKVQQDILVFFRQYEITGTTPTLSDFKENKKKKNANSLISELIDEHLTINSFSKSTENNYKQAKKHLYNYNNKLTIEDIDLDFYHHFKKWFFRQTYQVRKNSEPQHYTINTFGTIIKVIKSTINNLPKDFRSLIDTDIKDRNFKTVEEMADTVYLSEEELLSIHRLSPTLGDMSKLIETNITHNIIRKLNAIITAKNWFLLGAYTALRVSDFSRLRERNFKDQFIVIKPRKGATKNEDLYIPIHPVVREIMEDPAFDIQKPISDQKLNKQIKDVCKLAGIDDEIIHSRTEGGRLIEKINPKYELITNHTARRSAATNMFKAGIPALNIMKITGHKTESSFMKYIKISQEENALLMAKHQFFR